MTDEDVANYLTLMLMLEDSDPADQTRALCAIARAACSFL